MNTLCRINTKTRKKRQLKKKKKEKKKKKKKKKKKRREEQIEEEEDNHDDKNVYILNVLPIDKRNALQKEISKQINQTK